MFDAVKFYLLERIITLQSNFYSLFFWGERFNSDAQVTPGFALKAHNFLSGGSLLVLSIQINIGC